jgi:hypothetical protein
MLCSIKEMLEIKEALPMIRMPRSPANMRRDSTTTTGGLPTGRREPAGGR